MRYKIRKRILRMLAWYIYHVEGLGAVCEAYTTYAESRTLKPARTEIEALQRYKCCGA